MYCTNCGAKLADDARFCYNCGAKVADVPGSLAPSSAAAAEEKKAVFTVPAVSGEQFKKIVPDAAAFKPAGAFSGMDLIALAAAVLSVVFAICSIKVYMTWLTLIAALLLAFMCFIRLKSDSLLMSVPMTVFAVSVLVTSIRAFKYLRYYKVAVATQTVMLLIFALCAALFYWLTVFNVGNKKKMTTATVAFAAGYAITCISTSLSGNPTTFLVFAGRLAAILFMIAYVLRIAETSEALAPSLPAGYTADMYAGGNDYVHYPHPYQKLGGYLKFTVIGGTIVSVLAMILVIVAMIPVFRALSYVRGYANITFLYIIIIVLMIVSIFLYGLIIWILMKIKNKDPKFLWDYHKLAIAEVLVVFAEQWISNGFGTAVIHLVLFFLLFFIYTLYFVRSVRVRTYMQSDEYLRIDPFTRKVKSPVPADIAPYEEE